MCDISTIRRATCYGSAGNRLKPVKLTKWELPLQASKSYWDGVCAEIEKKYKRVRDPYPSFFPFPELSKLFTKTQPTDDIKFKISPPTPMHNTLTDSLSNFKDNSLMINDRQKNSKPRSDINKSLKLPPATSKRKKTDVCDRQNKKFKEIKIYPKQSCPRHKNVSAVKIFDDEISKYLQRPKSSVPKLPRVTTKKTFSNSHQEIIHRQSTSASSICSKSDEIFAKNEAQERKISKAPKLGMASLLPSFAKAVSIDSSVGTRESFDSEKGSIIIPSETSNNSHNKMQRRDFLHVPNLSFVSSHPSFRKLSLVDSGDEEEDMDSRDISIMSKKDFIDAEKNLTPDKNNLQFKEQSIEKDKYRETKVAQIRKIDTEPKKKKSVSDYQKKYAYKALDVLAKKKFSEIAAKTEVSSTKTSQSSEESIKSEKCRPKKLERLKKEDSVINFKEISTKLKEHVVKYLNSDTIFKPTPVELDRTDSITIYSTSRSTSGSSPAFENTAIAIPAVDILEKIPKTKVFQRANIDRCHACIRKPSERSIKIKRELPLATLKSIVDNSPRFRPSSSSSDSTVEGLQNFISYDFDDENLFDSFEFSEHPSELSTISKSQDKLESKDHLKVSFDKKSLVSTPKSRTETLSPVVKSQTQSDHNLKERSFSVQSSDRSKTSTPSNQSSDSEESRPQEDKGLPTSKYMAPCHAPVIWRKSLEPLRALKLKKAISLRARAAALTAESSITSGSDSDDDNCVGKLETKKQEEVAVAEAAKKDKKELPKKEKGKKRLIRMKTVVEKMTAFSASIDALSKDVKSGKMLKRAKTTFDLLTTSDDSRTDESEEEEVSDKVDTDSKIEKEEPLPYFDAIVMHRAGSPPPPIMSNEDIIDIVQACLKKDFDASTVMEELGKEFAKRIDEKCRLLEGRDDQTAVEYLKLGLKLFKSLIDSRRYLKSDIFDPNLEFSHKQPPLTNTRQLRRILPPKSYELVAPILGMPKYVTKLAERKKVSRYKHRNMTFKADPKDDESELAFDLIVHPPTTVDSSGGSDKYYEKSMLNPYALFLKKPRRKAVVWRPLREEDMKGYDPEATLQMRAARLMDRICKDFCQWLKQLGGTGQVIDEETLKDMFEINFTAEACKAMQVILKELPTVPAAVAATRNCPAASELPSTRKQIKRDLKLETRPKRSFAFGRSLPTSLRFIPPRNKLSAKWLSCENIPQDLETMDAVWNGIMHLDSVGSFINFLQNNPQIAGQKLLTNLERRKKEHLMQLGHVEEASVKAEYDNIAEPTYTESESVL